MIAYDDLVARLHQWRARTGLAAAGSDYLGPPTIPALAAVVAARPHAAEASLDESVYLREDSAHFALGDRMAAVSAAPLDGGGYDPLLDEAAFAAAEGDDDPHTDDRSDEDATMVGAIPAHLSATNYSEFLSPPPEPGTGFDRTDVHIEQAAEDDATAEAVATEMSPQNSDSFAIDADDDVISEEFDANDEDIFR
jgi:hypothetical protein